MTNEQEMLSDFRLLAAVDELQGLIASRFPEATFSIGLGDDPEGVYLSATVDTDDLFELIDLVSDRLVDFQIDVGLPLYFMPRRSPERNLAILREQLRAHPHWAPPSSSRAVGA